MSIQTRDQNKITLKIKIKIKSSGPSWAKTLKSKPK